MKLVIDIPNFIYEEIRNITEVNIIENNAKALYNAIYHGTPLPKGYGRWLVLSEEKVKEYLMKVDFSCQKWISEVNLSFATFAIIEADKEAKADVV